MIVLRHDVGSVLTLCSTMIATLLSNPANAFLTTTPGSKSFFFPPHPLSTMTNMKQSATRGKPGDIRRTNRYPAVPVPLPKLGGGNAARKVEEEEETSDVSGTLRSLLDDAVMLYSCSKDNSAKAGDAMQLVEDIGQAFYDLGSSSRGATTTGLRLGPALSSREKEREEEDAIRKEILKKIDEAVLFLYALPSKGENIEEKDRMVEQVVALATEYHRLDDQEGVDAVSSHLLDSNASSDITNLQLRVVKMKETLQLTPDPDPITDPGPDPGPDPTIVLNPDPAIVLNPDPTLQPFEPQQSITSSVTDNSEKQSVANTVTNKIKTQTVPIVTDSTKQITPEIKIETESTQEAEEIVDIAIVGAGIGGLCAGAILNTLYGKKVGIYESHYLAGGCAHAFDRVAEIPAGTDKSTNFKPQKMTFTFDSGPTIVLGCSTKPYNPLRQILNAVGLGEKVEWIPYDGWGMIEHPTKENEVRWKMELGPDLFQRGPLMQFSSFDRSEKEAEDAVKEFNDLRTATEGLVKGAVAIPAMAMRSGSSALVPLLRYLPALISLMKQGEELTQGTFAPYMDGPIFEVKNPWLRNWLDALAFSLSGLPARRTAAAAMAYVLYDMHRPGAALDYPKGGLGKVVDALVEGVEQGENGSKVKLSRHVESIDTSADGGRIVGLTLQGGKKILAKEGVICNVPVWSLNGLIKNEIARRTLNNYITPKKRQPRQTWVVPGGDEKSNNDKRSEIQMIRPEVKSDEVGESASLLAKCDTAEMTGSFLHLHLALDASGLDLDSMEAHYTVMDRGLDGDQTTFVEGGVDGPCGELNMIAVSNPCVLDRTLAPEGYIVVHAYGAGNEPYELWKGLKRNSPEYKKLKEDRAKVLWRAVESIIPDARDRVVTDLIGSPITHERFLRRPRGTYGSATEDYLKDGSTPFEGLVLCGDGIFPGIGVPAVALSGASAANSLVSPLKQWRCLDKLKKKDLI